MGSIDQKVPTANPDLLREQLDLLNADPSTFATDQSTRQSLLEKVKKSVSSLEEPFETMQRLSYSILPLVAARIALDHKIFVTVAQATAEKPADVQMLSTAGGLDPLFVETLMDYLCTQFMVAQVKPGHYAATPLTNKLLIPLFGDAIIHFHDSLSPPLNNLNDWLHQEKQSKSSEDHSLLPASPFNRAFNTTEDYYTFLTHEPVKSVAFYNFMTAQFASLPTWLSAVKFPEEFNIDLNDAKAVAFVDIAGGNGVQCNELLKHSPGLKGRVVLQDKPEVLARAETDPARVERMSYNYFDVQPIQDAKIYYLRQILHNNSDATCHRILRNQAAAMSASSLLIVDDKVLPDPTPDSLPLEYPSALSFAMKVMFNAQERREAHWRRVLGAAGLRVVDIRKFTEHSDCVILCVKG